jgi:Arc/MetJ-type ribon-helix-helix transcriptional regulator
MKTSIYLNQKTQTLLGTLLKTDKRFSSKSDVVRFALEELAKQYGLFAQIVLKEKRKETK